MFWTQTDQLKYGEMKMSDEDRIVAVCCLWRFAYLQGNFVWHPNRVVASCWKNAEQLKVKCGSFVEKKSVYRLTTESFSKIEMHYFNLSAMEWSIFYFENILILWNTVKSTMHHLIRKIYEIFQSFFHLASRKTSKLQISWQNEKLNYLIALQLRVGGVENYCPSNTGQDWWH